MHDCTQSCFLLAENASVNVKILRCLACSYDRLFFQQKWLDVPCLKLILAKALGYATIVGSFGLKVPQILAILKSRDVEGLVPVSMYSEVTRCVPQPSIVPCQCRHCRKTCCYINIWWDVSVFFVSMDAFFVCCGRSRCTSPMSFTASAKETHSARTARTSSFRFR